MSNVSKNYKNWGLFKKLPYAIFVCETNPDPPAFTIASEEILFLLVSSLFHSGAVRWIPG